MPHGHLQEIESLAVLNYNFGVLKGSHEIKLYSEKFVRTCLLRACKFRKTALWYLNNILLTNRKPLGMLVHWCGEGTVKHLPVALSGLSLKVKLNLIWWAKRNTILALFIPILSTVTLTFKCTVICITSFHTSVQNSLPHLQTFN